MNDEHLSALLDGECRGADLDRALDALDREPGLKARYSRFCLAREGAQGTRLRSPDLEFSQRVLDGIGPADVEPLTRVRRPRWQPGVGLAAAAAVAAVAVLALRPQPTVPDTTVAHASQGTVLVAPRTVVNPPPERPVHRQWAQLDGDAGRRLNAYLRTYHHSRAQQGVGSTLGHARYAAHVTTTATDRDASR